MIVIPAVDVRGGRCVRLREGRAEAETIVAEDPVAMAKRWVDLGAERLHIIDLDGALGGPRQTALVRRMIEAAAPVPVQAGGGLRDEGAVAEMLDAGARWGVVGTRAALDPAFLTAACRKHSARVIVAGGRRGAPGATQGWARGGGGTVIA